VLRRFAARREAVFVRTIAQSSSQSVDLVPMNDRFGAFAGRTSTFGSQSSFLARLDSEAEGEAHSWLVNVVSRDRAAGNARPANRLW